MITPQTLFALYLALSLVALLSSIAAHLAFRTSDPLHRLSLISYSLTLMKALVVIFIILASVFLFMAIEQTMSWSQ